LVWKGQPLAGRARPGAAVDAVMVGQHGEAELGSAAMQKHSSDGDCGRSKPSRSLIIQLKCGTFARDGTLAQGKAER
jgi:hypothetical protein